MNLFRNTFIVFTLLILAISTASKANAATLTQAKNTITTSRPSPSSPLNAALGATDTNATIFANESRFLASDSAKVKKTATGVVVDAATVVGSQSAALTTVYFGEQAGTAAVAAADVLFVPITAMHTFQFTVVNTVPTNGDLVFTFPLLISGDADDDASPSATTFQFNNLVTGTGGRDNIEVWDDAAEITANVTITETEPGPGSPGILSINVDSGSIAAGSVVKLYFGCNASTAGSCSTQVPRIINPTKSTTGAAGTADRWKIRIDTEDASDVLLDTATVAVATIESVQVLATVDPTLTFTIAGINNGTAINNGNATGCTNSETTNAGLASTATVVNMGILGNTPTGIDTKVGNIAAQLLTITTNATNGYALTATASSPLRSHESGFDISSSTTPAVFPNGTPWFGIHPCGLDVGNSTTWTETGASQTCSTHITGSAANECKYGWPTQTTALSLSSDTTGPIGNSIVAGNGLTSVEYAGGVDASVPAGVYQSYITYVATATF